MTQYNTTNSSPDNASTPVVVVNKNVTSDAPIRFPHIPARDKLPHSGTTFQNLGVTHRVDAIHPRMGSAATVIPGIRTHENAVEEAADSQLVPEPAEPPIGDQKTPRVTQELVALSEQMRRRLMDFGNLLTSRNYDARVEKAFETVCQSFSQLQQVVERNAQ